MVARVNRSLLELKAACLNRECWKIQNPRGLHVAREDARLARRLQYTGRGCIPSDVLRKKASEGEGACSPTEARRPHLPLRGKLGWMTPRAGWKQPEIGVHPPLFHGRRIDPFRTLLLDSSTA